MRPQRDLNPHWSEDESDRVQYTSGLSLDHAASK